MTLPLHTLEWTRLVLLLESPNGSEPESLLDPSAPQLRANVGQRLVQRFNEFTTKYHNHAEVTAFDEANSTTVETRRIGRRAAAKVHPQAQMAGDPKDDSVRLSPTRLKAISNTLEFGVSDAPGLGRGLEILRPIGCRTCCERDLAWHSYAF